MKDKYPYNEAFDDLIVFLNKVITNEYELQKILKYLYFCKKSKELPIRSIHQKFMKYCDDTLDYQPLSLKDKKMWDDLFYFWG